MKFILSALIFSSLVQAQVGRDCESLKKDPKVLLIYQTHAEIARQDPMADLALWKSFQMKFTEKIPALIGNRALMNENQSMRQISLEEKERILKCFHGDKFVIPRHPDNKLESGIPLLDPNDPEKLENHFKGILNELQKSDDQKNIEMIEQALEKVQNFNHKKVTGDLSCLTEIPGVEDRKNPIKKKEFLEMFRRIICKSGIKPTMGKTHTWNKEFLKGRMNPPFSKLLVALANGDTKRIMPTGKEDELTDWIVKQDPRSIQLHDMFEKAYLLNHGNVYETFLTIENVLSENFYMGGPNREKITISTKLGKIINHHGGEFDLFGPWYHLFGMLLYGYADGSGLKATLMGKVETGTALFYEEYNDRQENYMIAGGRIGAKLKRQLKKIKTPEDFKNFCQGFSQDVKTEDYLDLTEKLPDKIRMKK